MDPSLLVNPPASSLLHELTCPICHAILRDAVYTECEHAFCRGCLADWQDKGSQTCPLCRQALSTPGGRPPRVVRNALDELVFTCPNAARGCPATPSYAAFRAHVERDCPLLASSCPVEGCDAVLTLAEMEVHLQEGVARHMLLMGHALRRTQAELAESQTELQRVRGELLQTQALLHQARESTDDTLQMIALCTPHTRATRLSLTTALIREKPSPQAYFQHAAALAQCSLHRGAHVAAQHALELIRAERQPSEAELLMAAELQQLTSADRQRYVQDVGDAPGATGRGLMVLGSRLGSPEQREATMTTGLAQLEANGDAAMEDYQAVASICSDDATALALMRRSALAGSAAAAGASEVLWQWNMFEEAFALISEAAASGDELCQTQLQRLQQQKAQQEKAQQKRRGNGRPVVCRRPLRGSSYC